MSKLMHKIVLFIEPSEDACLTPLKIGNLFMNRIAVDEDAGHEILKIFELKTSTKRVNDGSYDSDKDSDPEIEDLKKQKGMDLEFLGIILYNLYSLICSMDNLI